MATVAGAHADRVGRVRDLQSVRGRKEHGRFVFEGPTLLAEAVRSGTEIEELYVTEGVYEHSPAVRALEDAGTPVFLVDDRTARKISDLETPPGLIGVTIQRLGPVESALEGALSLVLADLNDPGNVGTLLRSAEAFAAGGVVLGSLGVDPYHPKVVRSAMGAVFRLRMAVADAETLRAACAGRTVAGLTVGGEDIASIPLSARTVLVVGHERRGLGAWASACTMMTGIPMCGGTESLNAAVAGSIGLYALSLRCQESLPERKSQVFPC